MPIPENDRLDLRQALTRVLESEHLAEVAMEAMPPLDYDQLATKTDLDVLGRELRGEINQVRSELLGETAGLRAEMAELRGEINQVRSELLGETAGLRAEMAELRGEINQVRSELLGETAGLRGEIAELRGEINQVRSELLGETAGLRGETAGLRGEMAELRGDFKADLASNLRLMLAGQLTTMMMLGAWITAVT